MTKEEWINIYADHVLDRWPWVKDWIAKDMAKAALDNINHDVDEDPSDVFLEDASRIGD